MARHSGKNLKVKLDSNFIDGCRDWEITETSETVDLTAAGDAWNSHEATQKSWNGSFNCLRDDEDTGQAALAVGDSVTIEAYSEGDTTGKEYFTGTCTITEIGAATGYSSEATRKVSFMGNGALSSATVA
ncbi:phage tail tube protein [Vannielia litorea]|uniref:phage tail tube protein n=1 Tax=Vannielia litorea TaxID=1217970 RepID=UPI001BCB892B|nr:hypothetical protein [Vannielia litorea]MBS8228407.1 hypothetical protein [Vannielia litorea]